MAPYEKVAEGALSIIDQLIDDGDLALKLKQEMQIMLLTTKTTGFVDGSIKILMAFRDIVIPMLRPIGAFYLSYMGVDIALAELASGGDVSALSMGLSTAFPAWGASRHNNKNNEEKTKRVKIKTSSTDYDPDFDD